MLSVPARSLGSPLPATTADIQIQARMPFLDGIRGLAIVLVMLYHAYVRWPALVPYHDRFQTFPLFAQGWIGLPLFFLLSGYLIARTLCRCRSITEFYVRRWSRLFPAMLICSLFLYLTAPLVPERPAGRPDLLSLLPGLTFLDESWWSKLLGIPVHGLEGSFWSLYTEAKFYVLAALLYFGLGRRALCLGLSVAFLLGALVWLLVHPLRVTSLAPIDRLVTQLSLLNFGWFAAGSMWFFHAHEQNRARWLSALAWILCAASALVWAELAPAGVASALLISLLFVLAQQNQTVQRVLSHRLLLYFGLVSYPLFLLHENLLIALLVKLAPTVPSMLWPLLPIPIALGLSLLAYPIARYLEPPAERLLRTRLLTPRVGS